MRRKLFYYTLYIMAGICIAELLGKAILLLLLPALYLTKKCGSIKVYLIAFFFGVLLLLCFQFRFTHGPYAVSAAEGRETVVSGMVLEAERKDADCCQLTIDSKGEKILATYYQNIETPWNLIGKEIVFSTVLELPEEAGNPRTFDYRRYLLTREIEYTCTISSLSLKENQMPAYFRLKRKLLQKRENYLFVLSLSDRNEGVLRGILFGDKNQMDEAIYEDFRKNGTAHILAVSGLHVGILYGIYRWIYERKKKSWISVCFLGFLFAYGTAALWTVSVTRAVGLIVLVVLGRIFERRYDLLTALSAMALFSIVKNPYTIFGAAFQMSFLAVVSITFLQPVLVKIVGEKWGAAVAVQAGLLPYMGYTFNYISLVGILCNVPVIFLASILVPLGMAGFISYLCLGLFLPGTDRLLESVTEMMIWCNSLFTADGVLSFDVISPPLGLIILLYGLMFFLTSEYFHIYFCRKEWKKLLMSLLLILVCTASGFLADCSAFDKAELIFVDVGQGDCLHIKTSANRQVLIDGGGKFGYNTGEKTLKPYLLKNRISKIDLAAATHLHLDHFAGLEELAACYPVKTLMTQGRAGQKIHLEDDYWLEILWPKKQNPDTDDENENSLIFMVHHNGLKTLMTGDITAEGETMLLNAYKGTDKLRADILKIAHHGSGYSSSDAFLLAVQPQVAVISVGKNNYGHPSEIVIEKLEENGIMVFRTDLDGAVGIINRKGKLSVCTEKQR